jgi:hypothetical protein
VNEVGTETKNITIIKRFLENVDIINDFIKDSKDQENKNFKFNLIEKISGILSNLIIYNEIFNNENYCKSDIKLVLFFFEKIYIQEYKKFFLQHESLTPSKTHQELLAIFFKNKNHFTKFIDSFYAVYQCDHGIIGILLKIIHEAEIFLKENQSDDTKRIFLEQINSIINTYASKYLKKHDEPIKLKNLESGRKQRLKKFPIVLKEFKERFISVILESHNKI